MGHKSRIKLGFCDLDLIEQISCYDSDASTKPNQIQKHPALVLLIQNESKIDTVDLFILHLTRRFVFVDCANILHEST